MTGPSELALVQKALSSGLRNCVEWINDKTENRVQSDPSNQGLTPREIRDLLIDHVVNGGGTIQQHHETREQWQDRREFWYSVIVPIDLFEHGLFVELEVGDDDPDVPVVLLLNAHPQRK